MKLLSTILLLSLSVFSTVSAADNPLIRGSRELRADEGKARKLEKPTTTGKPVPEPKDPEDHPGYETFKGCGRHYEMAYCDQDPLCCWKGDSMNGNGYLCGEIGQCEEEEEPEEPEEP